MLKKLCQRVGYKDIDGSPDFDNPQYCFENATISIKYKGNAKRNYFCEEHNPDRFYKEVANNAR